MTCIEKFGKLIKATVDGKLDTGGAQASSQVYRTSWSPASMISSIWRSISTLNRDIQNAFL